MWNRLANRNATENNNLSTESGNTVRRDRIRGPRSLSYLLPSYDGGRKNVTEQAETQSTEDVEEDAKVESIPSPNPRNTITPSAINRPTGIFSSFVRGSIVGTADADIERQVSLAACNFSDEVQKIVTAAKKGGSNASSQDLEEWKSRLLNLLCGNFGDLNPKNGTKPTDLDNLLQNNSCEKFVLRCVEQDLPPNLIHCLRLLRVLEFQNTSVESNDGDGIYSLHELSKVATSKVKSLLCMLCIDPIVGEQVRPHLFGLLALSGASYPANGVHVAEAASSVIIAFAEGCLSTSIVQFLHEKKLIIYMTEDIKELCGMTKESSPGMRCLSGSSAEEAGLWVISLKTIVHLVTNSCQHDCLDLITDFDGAGGYHVLTYAISRSGENNTNELLKLVAMLVCCRTESSDTTATSHSEDQSSSFDEEFKLVRNIQALVIVEDLMVRTIPLLKTYAETHHGKLPDFSSTNLKDLSSFSMSIGKTLRNESPNPVPGFNILSEVLIMTLQLYSDHGENYNIIEPKFNILSLYLLSYPTFSDVSTKILTLKTLEYVCTGIHESDTMKPLTVASEIFAAMCCTLLSNEHGEFIDGILTDTEMLCQTFEKLLQVNENVSRAMHESGLLDDKMNSFLSLVVSKSEKSDSVTETNDELSKDTKAGPPPKTDIDGAFNLLCRILKFVVCQHYAKNNISDSQHLRSSHQQSHYSGRINLHVLLTMGITTLGDHASKSALSVFEAILTDRKAPDTFHDDVSCLIDVLEQLSTATSKRYPQNISCPDSLDSTSILRQVKVVTVFEVSLQTNTPVHEIFRTSGGFESLIHALISVKDGFSLAHNDESDDEKDKVSPPIFDLISAIFALLSAATKSTSTGKLHDGDSNVSSRAEINKLYLRRSGFYSKFSNAITRTGILQSDKYAFSILKLALLLMAPNLQFSEESNSLDGCSSLQSIENPDASRLVLGIAVSLPPNLLTLSKNALDAILSLCEIDKTESTLPQIASCGLALSLTSQNEFGRMLGNKKHALHSRFVLLLTRISGFNMSYTDFVGLLRCVAGPILLHDTENAKRNKGKIDIPVISSSINTSSKRNPSLKPGVELVDETFHALEKDFCTRLETLSVIAQKGDRVSRCVLGGDNLNTVALYMQKVPVEDRFVHLAKEGRVKYVQIESVNSAAMHNLTLSGSSAPASTTVGDKVWAPFVSSGFSFSLWLRLPSGTSQSQEGSIFLLDLSSNTSDVNSPSQPSGPLNLSPGVCDFLSVWYDTRNQQICVLTSSTPRNEPVTFPLSPLCHGVWHHIIITFQPPKRSIMNKKAVLNVHINGRSLGTDVKVENVNLPPTSRVHIGVPNPVFAASGIVRDSLPLWELGPSLFVTEILTSKDATAIFSAGPDFKGLFWGDRPQRLSLTATATATFAMLAENGERGSVASALRRRNMPEVEATGQVIRGKRSQDENLASVGLLCSLNSENIVFGFSAHAYRASNNQKDCKVLVNIARINSNNVSTDAYIYGNSSIVDPANFADNLQWIGGPKILLPLVNAVKSSATLALALRIIRESTHRHLPNLENLQVGGGYRILGLLLRQKLIMDASVMDECFAFGVHGFKPGSTSESVKKIGNSNVVIPTWSQTERWVLSDLHAIKYLLLNHQVWDLRRSGPELPLRLLAFFNTLVSPSNFHAAFNSRRLHLLSIVKWTIHLMLEAAELYDSAVDLNASNTSTTDKHRNSVSSQVWQVVPPSLKTVAVGGDPDNPILQSCKSLLRRVLTFMLTPDDLRDIAGATIYTLSITNGMNNYTAFDSVDSSLPPGPVARIYLLRLLEELVVDGVNEIVSANAESSASRREIETLSTPTIQPHGGGVTNSNQSYLGTTMGTRRRQRPQASDDAAQHPKHQQAQAFLSAFASILTPIWFACVLEGSHEEASASAALRLLILMLQSSPTFCNAFENSSGFSPLVLSIPKFSTSPSITMVLLSQLLHAPILHLPCLSSLDASLLMEVFDMESDATELVSLDNAQGELRANSDPSCGIFALLAECLGRNIQLTSYDNALGTKARETNEAVIRLLSHRHSFSSFFQEFCRTPDFLEPLAQALCLIHDAKMQASMQAKNQSTNDYELSISNELHHENNQGLPIELFTGQQFLDEEDHGLGYRKQRRSTLKTVNTSVTPTQRFVGGGDDAFTSSGFGMVKLLHLVLSHAVLNGQLAAALLSDLFKSFPIHASLQQVEAYHLVLIEHCSTVVEDALQRGQPVAIANCIGLSSVLLDRLMTGFFTSEPVLNTVNIILKTLRFLTATGTYASRTLGLAEQTMLVADTAHLARLTCLTALKRSCPRNPYDEGDSDLKYEVLKKIAANLRQLLIIPGVPSTQSGKRGQSNSVGSNTPPAPGTPMYHLYQYASLTRYAPNSNSCNYPDLHAVDQPDRAFVVALMSALHEILMDERMDIREQAVEVVVSLLQQRRGFMSELLIADINRGEDKMETVDLMNRGGFGALLVAHEAATIAENISTVPRRSSSSNRKTGKAVKLKHASFFEWLERNRGQVDAVFHNVHILAFKLLPGIGSGAATPEEAIENEQKVMLLKMTAQDTSDKTIQGGLERAEHAHDLHEKTSRSHAAWKRQGFDDLSSGAMKWKMLLRQLKGTHSVWEGGDGFVDQNDSSPVFVQSLSSTSKDDDKDVSKTTLQTRWKLDLSEGFERQRRRLLPNYEFQKLYNLDEMINSQDEENLQTLTGQDQTRALSPVMPENGVNPTASAIEASEKARRTTLFEQNQESVEATAALLRKMTIRTAKSHGQFSLESLYRDDDESTFNERNSDDEYSENGDLDQSQDYHQGLPKSASITENTKEELNAMKHESLQTDLDNSSEASVDSSNNDKQDGTEEHGEVDNIFASSYDVITGILEPGDWPEKSYNVKRCTGLEVRDALLLWCRDAIYIVDGFEQKEGDGLEGKINRLEMSTSTFYINLRPDNFVSMDRVDRIGENSLGETPTDSHGHDQNVNSVSRTHSKEGQSQVAGDEVTYQHTSRRISFSDIYSVYRRRYQLQQIALEFFDVHRNGTLLAFSSKAEREEVLAKVLASPLPNSIFSLNNQFGTSTINYDKFMNSLRAKITNEWVQGRITNFDFLMHLNSFAGRTYNDLTQYPVFPWILSDYESSEIDLEDPTSYRDLSKPMGAQGDERAEYFRERFEVLESNTAMSEHEPPPFHYGTHYSCAAYVLHYLMRLEPFSRLALSLQGGRFDVPDRLFHSVKSSWLSASKENLQDVREVIPEFYYFPEFLENIDMFDFGTTQSGKVVHHVTLPPWADGDPRKFTRINRRALESEYVSKNLHNWIDLIFGYKQCGREAVKVLTFISTTMSLFDTNGNVLATKELDSYDTHSRPSCTIATGCPEWTEEGIVAVTGHNNGDKRLWSLDYKNETLMMRHLVSDKIHSCLEYILRTKNKTKLSCFREVVVSARTISFSIFLSPMKTTIK